MRFDPSPLESGLHICGDMDIPLLEKQLRESSKFAALQGEEATMLSAAVSAQHKILSTFIYVNEVEMVCCLILVTEHRD